MASLCNIRKKTFLSKNHMKNVALKLVSGPFKFSGNPLWKGIWGGVYAVWTNFDSFAITCLIQVAHFKNLILQ